MYVCTYVRTCVCMYIPQTNVCITQTNKHTRTQNNLHMSRHKHIYSTCSPDSDGSCCFVPIPIPGSHRHHHHASSSLVHGFMLAWPVHVCKGFFLCRSMSLHACRMCEKEREKERERERERVSEREREMIFFVPSLTCIIPCQ